MDTKSISHSPEVHRLPFHNHTRVETSEDRDSHRPGTDSSPSHNTNTNAVTQLSAPPALAGHDFQLLGLQQCWTRNGSALRSVWFCMFKCLMLVPHMHNVLRCTTGGSLCETGTRHKLWQWEPASWRWCYKKHLGRSFGACHMNYKCSCLSPWQVRSLENESLECTLWFTEKQLCRKIQNTVSSSARGSCSESRWHVQCTYQGTNVSISKQNKESKDQGYLHL